MKRVLGAIAVLAAALIVALVVRVRQLRAATHGPAGGTGVVEGVDIDVTSRIATRILRVHVREGDLVKQGDLLVELDCTEQDAVLAQARSQLDAAAASLKAAQSSATSARRSASAGAESATAARSQIAVLEAQEKLARTELERTERLVGTGALPQAALDDARARHETLVSQIASQRAAEGASQEQAGALTSAGGAARSQALAAEGNVEAARAAVARADVLVRECALVAPRTALVATRNLEPGEAVQPGSVILGLTDIEEARTRFYLPNDELAVAAPGKRVRVVADAYPKEVFFGTILSVSPRAEFTPRNVQTRKDRERLVYAVEVRIPNADHRLRAGMPVEVSIEGTWR